MAAENKRLVKVGDTIRLKSSERKFSKLSYGEEYKVEGIEPNNGYWDGSSYITAISDKNGCVITLRMYENFFDIIDTAVVKDKTLESKKFKIGDKVISVKNTADTEEGFIGFIEREAKGSFDWIVKTTIDVEKAFYEHELELLSVSQSSIARPVLEERKIGKVQMDLFDSGFPNATTEVAKVMTWAAENKGYKPHDWKGLPNAETEFSAAASRHRVKGFIQKAEGIAAIDRTDEESNIVHLAHAAFNILAELELVLTGKIK